MLFLTLETANKEEKPTIFVQSITFHHNNHSSYSLADPTQTSLTVSNKETQKVIQQYKIAANQRKEKERCVQNIINQTFTNIKNFEHTF